MGAHTPLRKGDVLVFEHIPKNAGSTFRTVLSRWFGDTHVKHTNVFDPKPRLKRLQARFSDDPPIRALSTHIGYGLHERLPGDLHYVHFTFLRDPVDRTISHYYYALDKGKIEEGTSLIDFCNMDAPAIFPIWPRNFQTVFLSGLRVRALLDGELPGPEDHAEALLEQAIRNLDTFPALGLVSRYEESLLLFGHTFGWPLSALCYVTVNKGTRRPRQVELTDEEREVVMRVNKLDFALYQHAERRFERLLAERVPDVPGQLRVLRRLNRAYRSAPHVANKIIRTSTRMRRALGA